MRFLLRSPSIFLYHALRQAMRFDLGIGGSLWEQLVRYIIGIFQGDLGNSTVLSMPVWDALMLRLPWTLLVMIAALILSTVIGTVLGILSARANGRAADMATMASVLLIARS